MTEEQTFLQLISQKFAYMQMVLSQKLCGIQIKCKCVKIFVEHKYMKFLKQWENTLDYKGSQNRLRGGKDGTRRMMLTVLVLTQCTIIPGRRCSKA